MQKESDLKLSDLAKRTLNRYMDDMAEIDSLQLRTDSDKLLQLVISADVDAVIIVINKNVTLLFDVGSAVDLDGKTIEMSPMQYALYVCDKQMLTLFEEACRKQKLTGVYYDQTPEKYFDFEPFKAVAKEYLADAVKEQQDTFWDEKVGVKKLRMLLPAYMLRQLSNGTPLQNLSYPPSVFVRKIEVMALTENENDHGGSFLHNWRFWRNILYYLVIAAILIYICTHLSQVTHWLHAAFDWLNSR